MVAIDYDHERGKVVVTICGGNVEVVYETTQPTVKDETPDGKPLIILAA